MHVAVLAEAIGKLVEKRAVRELTVPVHTPGFYSRVFLVPKKGSTELRMIHNLKSFNKDFLAQPPTFKMLSLTQLKLMIRAGDFLASLDLKDAYLHVPIHPDCHKYLRFVFQGRHYEWLVLPFGISVAPWLFTRITTPMVGFLHRRRIRFGSYLDDMLTANASARRLTQELDFAIKLFTQLGWILNLNKSELSPSQNLQFIGGRFDTVLHRLFVPHDRWDKIQPMVSTVLAVPQPVRFWQKLLGLFTSAQDATERGRLQVRPLQIYLTPFAQRDEPNLLVPLPDRLRSNLEWWTIPSNVLSGVSMLTFVATDHLYTDASMVGWGAHLDNEQVSGLWSEDERLLHINILEFQAVLNAIRHWQHRLRNRRLLISTDNATVAAYVNKLGGTHSRSLLSLTFEFYVLVDSIPLQVRATHIPGALNVVADALSRPGEPSPTEWQLNPLVFRFVCDRLHRPLVDLFATRFNHQLPVFVSPIPDPLAFHHDSLALNWDGMDAYAYPPIALVPRILAKIRQSVCRIILIAPLWPNRVWYPDLVALAQAEPLPLPERRDLLIHPHSRQFHPRLHLLNLHAWILSNGL